MTNREFNLTMISNEQSLLRYAYSLVTNIDEAKDLLQETFYKALANRNKLSDKTKVSEWMFSIMRNLFINSYRKKKRANDYINYKLTNTTNHDSLQSDSKYEYHEILNSIEDLSTNLKEPIKLYAVGYKYKEIAKELNLTIGTVKSRIFTARKLLSESLKDFN